MSWSWFRNLEFSLCSLREDLTLGFLTFYLTSWGVASHLASTVLCVPMHICVIMRVQPLTSCYSSLMKMVAIMHTRLKRCEISFYGLSHIVSLVRLRVDPEDTYVTLQGLLDINQLRLHVTSLNLSHKTLFSLIIWSFFNSGKCCKFVAKTFVEAQVTKWSILNNLNQIINVISNSYILYYHSWSQCYDTANPLTVYYISDWMSKASESWIIFFLISRLRFTTLWTL